MKEIRMVGMQWKPYLKSEATIRKCSEELKK